MGRVQYRTANAFNLGMIFGTWRLVCRGVSPPPRSDVADEERCELEICLQVPSTWKRDTNSAVAAV